MTKLDFIQVQKLYIYLNNLENKRFNLKDNFVQGSISDLGKRKIFGTSKACVCGYMPVIFNSWGWFDGIPLLKNNSSNLSFIDMAIFTGFSIEEVHQICIAKYYNKPNLDTVLRRIFSITRAYGHRISDK